MAQTVSHAITHVFLVLTLQTQVVYYVLISIIEKQIHHHLLLNAAVNKITMKLQTILFADNVIILVNNVMVLVLQIVLNVTLFKIEYQIR